jgi:hypothetical protein
MLLKLALASSVILVCQALLVLAQNSTVLLHTTYSRGMRHDSIALMIRVHASIDEDSRNEHSKGWTTDSFEISAEPHLLVNLEEDRRRRQGLY